jgi:competence protein ComFA
MFSFAVYLAWNSTHYRFFLCPPFVLDSKYYWSIVGRKETGRKETEWKGTGRKGAEWKTRWGDDPVWTRLAALTPPLPLGLADYVLNYLAGESEKQPSGAILSAAVKQVPPGIQASGWRYLGWMLKRWWPETAELGAGTAGLAGPGQMPGAEESALPGAVGSARHGQMSGAEGLAGSGQMPGAEELAGPAQIQVAVGSTLPDEVACLLRERRQLARRVLLSLEPEALPPGFRLDAEGYLRQLGPVRLLGPIRFLNGGPAAAGSLNLVETAAALKYAAKPASQTDDLTSPSPLCSPSVNLVYSTDSAAGLGAELDEGLLWVEQLLAGRALLPKEVQTLLAANQDQLPATLWDSGFRNGEAAAGVWVPAWMQAAFQVLALQGRALLRPAVGRDLRGQPLCYRCGQSDKLKPAVCGHCGRRACYYCESCNSLGLARECLPLYLVPGAKPASGKSSGDSGSKSSTAEQEKERDLAAKLHTEKTVKPLVVNEETEFGLNPDPDLSSYPFPVLSSVPVQLDFPLTSAQQRAAEEVRQFAAASPLKQCLVWAVCGAGKTEVVFPALAEALTRGGPVLYATPRRDVVQELAPRFRQAFPSFRVSQLYAGSGDRFAPADIYAATTHQTLRFYQNFDLVILDEVDAYPYRDSPLLHYAVRRASRPGGKIIYLTATPAAAMQQQARDGRELAVVYIPARHHGFPVPEPELISESRLRWPVEEPNSKRKFELPDRVVDLIQRAVSEEQSQLLIFVPAVRLAGIVAEAVSRQVEFAKLKWPMELAESAESGRAVKPARRGEPVKQFKQAKQVKNINQLEKHKQIEQIEPLVFPWWVQASHAGDPQREQKRHAFSQGDFPILVTTTILERGITIPRVNVMVLFADAEKIFDEGTLVQMAGRVGRTADFPQGKVWLVGSRVSPAMRSAQARIREMNRRARALGYLHEGREEAGQNAEQV